MSRALDVLVVSSDPLLSELLCGLFRQEGLSTVQVDTIEALTLATEVSVSRVVLFDITDDAGSDVFRAALPNLDSVMSGTTPAMLALAGSATPSDLLQAPGVDRILSAPFQATELLRSVQYHLDVRPKREMRSGVQIRLSADGSLPLPPRIPSIEQTG